MSGLRAYLPQGGLWEASGIGDYEKSGDWSWEYYPPPYDFLAPSDSVPMPAFGFGAARKPARVFRAPAVMAKPKGMGCGCGCSGNCGGNGHTHGMGDDGTQDTTAAPATVPGTLNIGSLFSAGLDFTQWGLGEWLVAGLGVYLIGSLVSDVGRGAKKVSAPIKRARRRARKRKQLQDEASAI